MYFDLCALLEAYSGKDQKEKKNGFKRKLNIIKKSFEIKKFMTGNNFCFGENKIIKLKFLRVVKTSKVSSRSGSRVAD